MYFYWRESIQRRRARTTLGFSAFTPKSQRKKVSILFVILRLQEWNAGKGDSMLSLESGGLHRPFGILRFAPPKCTAAL